MSDSSAADSPVGPAPGSGGAPRLRLTDVTRTYPGVRALDRVSMAIAPGEVIGLVGHNGAGKSTISKIIAGIERVDAGTIEIDGTEVAIRSPQEATELGMALVPQRLAVVGSLTTRDNLTLGLGRGQGRQGAGASALEEVCSELGIEHRLNDRARRLRPSMQRLTMIGRALLRSPRLLILDEPSAAFSSAETERLFEIVARLSRRGISIVYVSHRLEEVLRISSRVVAMAQGRVVAESSTGELTKGMLADLIAGRHVEVERSGATAEGSAARGRGPMLRMRNVTVAPKLSNVNMEVAAGEIVGLVGLVGSGRTTLLNSIWGVGGRMEGEVELSGKPFHPSTPRHAIRNRIAFVPEDRGRNSLLGKLTVGENVTLPSVRNYRAGFPLLVNRSRERAAVGNVLEKLDVRPRDATHRPIRVLSGGNQQKAIVARWLLIDVDLFLFDEPTEGVDVSGRKDIYALLRELAREGKSVLVSSSDVEEVVTQCDRVYVMREGTIAAEIRGQDLTLDRVSRACIA